jgi:hypothetical protein
MTTTTVPLHRLAKTIRSKNAGCHYYTMDIIFDERQIYEKVKRTGAITQELVAQLYRIPRDQVTHFFEYDPGCAIKITIRRPVSSGDMGDSDLYGCQQYAPLFDIVIPWETG